MDLNSQSVTEPGIVAGCMDPAASGLGRLDEEHVWPVDRPPGDLFFVFHGFANAVDCCHLGEHKHKACSEVIFAEFRGKRAALQYRSWT